MASRASEGWSHDELGQPDRVLETVKVSTHRCLLDHRAAPVIAFSFFQRDRSMLRLAGTRYLRVTVKLSVLLTQPRIRRTPSTNYRPAGNRSSSNTVARSAPPMTKKKHGAQLRSTIAFNIKISPISSRFYHTRTRIPKLRYSSSTKGLDNTKRSLILFIYRTKSAYLPTK